MGIPDDERGHYSVYRTEHGEQAMEDLISDDQLMIYCEALANAKGTLKFLFQRDREGRSQDVPTLPPALLASSSVAEVGPPTLTISPLLGASIRRPPYSQQHLETETGTHERKQTLQAVERHPDNQAKDLKSRLRKDIRYVAEERKKVLEKINAAQEASPNAAFLHGGAAPNCGAVSSMCLLRAKSIAASRCLSRGLPRVPPPLGDPNLRNSSESRSLSHVYLHINLSVRLR